MEGFSQLALLLLTLLLDSEGDELAKLETIVVVDVQLAESVHCDLSAHLSPVDATVTFDQFIQGEHAVIVGV